MQDESSGTGRQKPILFWLLLAAIIALLGFIFYDGLRYMVTFWLGSEEYSHGILLPFVAAYLGWQKRNELSDLGQQATWPGVLVIVAGMLIYLVGELSSLYIIVQYAFLLTLAGVLMLYLGLAGFRKILAPFAVLFFMIPLPQFIYNNLSSELQLISSAIGVQVIRLFGISVFLEGNVIDLGTYKLQVVEACSGLRYLFPLMSFAFICAYMFKARLWMRVLVFLSSMPITVFMNSFRIGVIGVLVEYFGTGAAEGFLHDFEGWIIFIACSAILLLEVWVLNKLFIKAPRFQDIFALDMPAGQGGAVGANIGNRGPLITTVLLLITALFAGAMGQRQEVVPARHDLTAFPYMVGEWSGKPDRLEDLVLNTLKLTDYVIADYSKGENKGVNFYAAYYASQRKGESAHSPRSCIPGGGWRIASHETVALDLGGAKQASNRLLIQLGDNRQLVYYWFQQRGRIITNEYLVKWYLFWDALTRNRSDGALVRLTTQVSTGEDIAKADQRLLDFARSVRPLLPEFIPE